MNQSPYAGLMRRVFSGILDFFLIIFLYAILALFLDPVSMMFELNLNYSYTSQEGLVRTLGFWNPSMMMAFFLIWVSYLSFSQYFFGASLGQFIIGCRIKSFVSKKLSLGWLFLRNLFLPIDIILTGLPHFSHSPRHQTLGDSLTNHTVVRAQALELPLHDKEIRKTQKIFGGFLWMFMIFLLALHMLTLQRASLTSEIAQNYFQLMKTGIEKEDLSDVYYAASVSARDAVSLEDITESILSDERLVDAFAKAQEFFPMRWHMTSTVTSVVGRTQNDDIMVITLVYENQKWKPVSIQVGRPRAVIEASETTISNEAATPDQEESVSEEAKLEDQAL